MSQQQNASRALTQSKEALLKTYNSRLRDNVKAMVDNYMEIIKLAKVWSNTLICNDILSGIVLECSISMDNALEIPQSFIKPFQRLNVILHFVLKI